VNDRNHKKREAMIYVAGLEIESVLFSEPNFAVHSVASRDCSGVKFECCTL